MIDGIPIMLGIEFARNEIDGDVEIVEVFQSANEGSFSGEGIICGDECIAGEKEEINLELIALPLDEFPGGGRSLLDERKQ